MLQFNCQTLNDPCQRGDFLAKLDDLLPQLLDFCAGLFDIGLILLHIASQRDNLFSEVHDIFEHNLKCRPQSCQVGSCLRFKAKRFRFEQICFGLKAVYIGLILSHLLIHPGDVGKHLGNDGFVISDGLTFGLGNSRFAHVVVPPLTVDSTCRESYDS